MQEKLKNMKVIVFAPHQDDEVLACGGTIIKRIRDGHQVFIVFMTDGRFGCGNEEYAKAEEVKSIRNHEAVQAAEAMGVPSKNVFFLNFNDGSLNKNGPDVKKKLLEVLFLIQPDSILLPNYHDSHPDHSFTNDAVLSVLRGAKLTAVINEYFVWDRDYKYRPKMVLAKYNAVEHVLDVLEEKMNALFEYKSQMTLYFSGQQKPFLNGKFLCRFIKGQENFIKYRIVNGEIKLENRLIKLWRYLLYKIGSFLAIGANASKKLNLGIVTSFYDGYGRFLLRWVCSIMASNTGPSIVTIVESGSNSGLDAEAREKCIYLLDQSNIPYKYMRIEAHKGMGYARNQAIKATNAEWIMYLDVDDMILPYGLDEIARASRHADVVCVGYKSIVDGKEADQTIFLKPRMQKILEGESCSCSHSPYKKKLWEQSPYIETNDFVEQALWIGFAHLKARFVGTKIPCTLYIRHPDSFMGRMTQKEKQLAREQREKFRREGVHL